MSPTIKRKCIWSLQLILTWCRRGVRGILYADGGPATPGSAGANSVVVGSKNTLCKYEIDFSDTVGECTGPSNVEVRVADHCKVDRLLSFSFAKNVCVLSSVNCRAFFIDLFYYLSRFGYLKGRQLWWNKTNPKHDRNGKEQVRIIYRSNIKYAT